MTARIFIWFLLVVVVLSAGAPPCSCNHGNVDETQPQCYCACYSGYLQPHCLYTAEDDVVMDIWVAVAPSEFYSVTLLQQLEWGLNLASNEATFLYAYPNYQYNKTNAFVKMKGNSAQQLLWDYYSNNSWLGEVHIESVWERVPSIPPVPFYDNELTVYRTTDGNIIITVEGYIWLVLALIVTLLVLLVDCCCFANDEDTVLAKDEEDDLYGVDHPSRPASAAPSSKTANPLQAPGKDMPSSLPAEDITNTPASRAGSARYSTRERR